MQNYSKILLCRRERQLPDATIAASPIVNNAILLTGDKGFKKLKDFN